MSHITRIRLALKALEELGFTPVGLYALYWLGLRTGYYKQIMRTGGVNTHTSPSALQIHQVLQLPDKSDLLALLGDAGVNSVLEEANEVLSGKVRLFGGPPVPLQLKTPEPLSHWTSYALRDQVNGFEDIKFIWEPGRFGWACTLARAYYLSGEEAYAEKFWVLTDAFLVANPPNMGLQWVSAQEVALRIIALTFSYQVFMGSPSSTTDRAMRLAGALAEHAMRIPPTLNYARAQNNNHLLCEATGLYTVGLLLRNHPKSASWRDTGWYWFSRAIRTQIADDGTYIQHSTSYHRLMLQAALWVEALANYQGEDLPSAAMQRLSNASVWLAQLNDPETGGVPNLGPNDGANILPLTVCSITDYRPVIQAAHWAFCGKRLFQNGLWDELSMWLKVGKLQSRAITSNVHFGNKIKPILRSSNSWAYLRAAEFTSRPGHADQLHLDLWWRGLNVAQDPGTYSYNASAPWDNALTKTAVHNTVAVNSLDQMTYAGRFLWLDWAQGMLVSKDRSIDGSWDHIIARHNGYRKLNIVHQREVFAHTGDRWIIEDRILPDVDGIRESLNLSAGVKVDSPDLMEYNLSLHWLLPDWEWSIKQVDYQVVLSLVSPYGSIELSAGPKKNVFPQKLTQVLMTQIVRAGEVVYGSGDSLPIRGWISPIYGYKKPSLSFSLEVEASLPFIFLSEWRFPSS